MRSSITLKPAPDGRGCHISVGNAGGSHGMTLSLPQMLDMFDWLVAWREAGTSAPFVAIQPANPKRKRA
jgi:hypothetical protein